MKNNLNGLMKKAGRYFNETTVKALTAVIFVVFLAQSIRIGVFKEQGNDMTFFLNNANVFFNGGNPYLIGKIILYPLFPLFIFYPFTLLPVWLAHVLWYVLNFTIFIISIQAFQSRFAKNSFHWVPFGLVVIPLLGIFQANLIYGQINIIVLSFLTAFVVFLKEKREVLAAFFLACAIAVKLVPVLFLIFLLINRRFLAAVLTVVFAFLLVFVIPYIVAGETVFSSYSTYYSIIAGKFGHAVNESPFGRYFSLGGFISKLGFGYYPHVLGLGLVVGGVSYFHYYMNRRIGRTDFRALYIYFPAILLVSPMSEVHHMIWAFPALLAVMHDLYKNGFSPRLRKAVTYAIIASFIVYNIADAFQGNSPMLFLTVLLFFAATFMWILEEGEKEEKNAAASTANR